MTRSTVQSAARFDWLDIAKGLGIIAVVLGHVLADDKESSLSQALVHTIYSFHMPLFFLLAGYTLKPENLSSFAWRRGLALGVPYLLFLVMLGLPSLAVSCAAGPIPLFGIGQCKTFAFRLLAGGSSIGGIFSVFWFIPCLFFAMLIAQAFLATARKTRLWPLLLGLLYVVAYLLPLALPVSTAVLAIGVAPLASIFVLAGYGLRHADQHGLMSPAWTSLALVGIAAAIVPQTIDMKYGHFGLPVIGMVASLSLSFAFILAARMLTVTGRLSRALSWIGNRSLVVMYLHQTIHYGLQAAGLQNAVIVTLISLVIPLVVADAVMWIIKTLTRFIEDHIHFHQGHIR